VVEVMEQVAQALTTGAAACREVAKRPLFGPTRVSVLRRVNALCIAGAPKGEVVVEALVQSGTVREGQVLHARLPAPIANRARDGPQPASALVTLAVVSILRFDKPRYRPRVVRVVCRVVYCATTCATHDTHHTRHTPHTTHDTHSVCRASLECCREAQKCVRSQNPGRSRRVCWAAAETGAFGRRGSNIGHGCSHEARPRSFS
jgi:hypothetical protein